jgi:hypothetical protein
MQMIVLIPIAFECTIKGGNRKPKVDIYRGSKRIFAFFSAPLYNAPLAVLFGFIVGNIG